MNKIIAVLFSLIFVPVVASAQAEKITPAGEMYMFGVAFSPLDSTVYITELQSIKEAYVYKKSKLLYDRSAYSSQLKRFLADTGIDRMVSSVSYASKRKDTEKKYLKMKQKYQKKGFLIKHITSADFSFKEVENDVEEVVEVKETKAEKKEKKSNKKKK
ncbi:MAG: hypothetical protein MJZ12_10050 [Prevotella sp.]|nr:hypothetical protein [Prevotella sp.]